MHTHRQEADAETRSSSSLPSALGPHGIRQTLKAPPFAVVLDYDGTLAPIRADPEDATMTSSTREALRRLADRCTVAVVSGRDLDDVREKVSVGSIAYAGSHGLDIQTPRGDRFAPEDAEQRLEDLDEAQAILQRRIGPLEARIERKRFSIAVHTRGIPDPERATASKQVDEALAQTRGLKRQGGKEVIELRPKMDWGKGRAIERLMDDVGFDADRYPIAYVGDDLTDEDAFRSPIVDAPVLVRGDERDTHARFALSGQSEVEHLLEELLETAST